MFISKFRATGLRSRMKNECRVRVSAVDGVYPALFLEDRLTK